MALPIPPHRCVEVRLSNARAVVGAAVAAGASAALAPDPVVEPLPGLPSLALSLALPSLSLPSLPILSWSLSLVGLPSLALTLALPSLPSLKLPSLNLVISIPCALD